MKIGILFDLDGTLLNSLEDLKDAVNYTMDHFGCPLRSLEEVRNFVGTGAANLIRKALPGRENDPPLTEALDFYQAYYAVHSRNKTAPYPGILQALAEIGDRYPIAIVSNKPDVATKDLCAVYFPGIFARGEAADCPRKPAPDMLYQAMDQIGVDTCVYVGDSETDIQTARNTGVKCLSVLWGFRDKACLTQAGGEYFCEDPADLLQKLEEMI
jgi:phosphoglycolate phosphatase